MNAENRKELTEIHTRRSLPPHRKVRAQKTQPAGWELGRQTPGIKGWPWMTVPGGRHVHRMVGEEPKMRVRVRRAQLINKAKPKMEEAGDQRTPTGKGTSSECPLQKQDLGFSTYPILFTMFYHI